MNKQIERSCQKQAPKEKTSKKPCPKQALNQSNKPYSFIGTNKETMETMAQPQAIVNPAISHIKQRYKPNKRRFKLQDPPIFTGRRDGMPVVEWLVKMKGKMTVDKDLMDTPWRRMMYVMSRVGGTAFGHLEPCDQEQHAQKNRPRPWKDSDKMLSYLEQVFGDSNRRRNAEYEF